MQEKGKVKMIAIVNLSEDMYEVVDLSSVDKRKRFITNGFTTFIGKRDDNSVSTLYLITYSCVVDLNDPSSTFVNNHKVIVDRWVDVTITIQPE
jgi:hypothetical protein